MVVVDLQRGADEIALPLSGEQSILDLGWEHVDALHVRNLAAPIRSTRMRLARAAALAQASDQLFAQLAAGHAL